MRVIEMELPVGLVAVVPVLLQMSPINLPSLGRPGDFMLQFFLGPASCTSFDITL